MRNYVDGARLHDLRVPFRYWQAKDADDDLDEEIAKTFRRGNPNTNIIVKASTQGGLDPERHRGDPLLYHGWPELERLLSLFFAYQRPEIAEFRKTVVQFQTDPPAVLQALRERIAGWWKAHDVRPAAAVRRIMTQLNRGPLDLEYATFQANDYPALKLVIYTPPA